MFYGSQTCQIKYIICPVSEAVLGLSGLWIGDLLAAEPDKLWTRRGQKLGKWEDPTTLGPSWLQSPERWFNERENIHTPPGSVSFLAHKVPRSDGHALGSTELCPRSTVVLVEGCLWVLNTANGTVTALFYQGMTTRGWAEPINFSWCSSSSRCL